MANVANVHIWDKYAGAILYDEATGVASFEYDSKFAARGWDLAPIKMPLSKARSSVFSFPAIKTSNTFKGLPGLLADVLPDKYGNALINAWLAAQGRTSDSLNPVETLCFIGKRGMGALEFEPVEPKSASSSTKLIISNLVQVAGDILSERKDFSADLSAEEEKSLLEILKIGTSAGGARAKAIIAFNQETKEVRSGQAAAPNGFTQWLIKFDGIEDTQFGASHGYGRVEMAYYLMARDCGINMMECRVLEENGRAHFMTRRFDRPDNKDKLHVQTFCAMQHYDFNEVGFYAYEQLFETMRMLQLPHQQHEQMFRRMVFNVLARNCDDHTKNHAFVMDRDGIWKLSPAYDICHAYRPGSTWVSQQSLSINGKRKNIDRKDFLSVAGQISLRTTKANLIIDEIKQTVGSWQNYAHQTRVDDKLKTGIEQTIQDQLGITK